MYAPHTVTVYNSVKETDLTTFEEVARLYVTILRGVMLQASKGVNVRESGLEGADAVNLYIPFGVEAVDGTTGAPKTYTGPQSFFKAADKSSLWTLSVNGDGGTTFFVKGEFVTDNETVALSHDDCYNLTKVDMKDFGSPDMQHFECGGA
jgi:hypothetical protein|nr:MAG TPA: hypothetical protein [Caudoviricetes sp.]